MGEEGEVEREQGADARAAPRDHHEALWEDVPEGLLPSDFERRLAFLLEHVLAGARVLDVGCGEGRFAQALLARGARVVGIDVAAEPLRRARARWPELGLDLRRVAPSGPWPLADVSFDVVWAGEVIEHVADTAGWLSEVRRVLRSGGTLLLSTPAHDALTRARLALGARAFEAHFDPRADHLRFYTRRALVALLADFGFEAITTRAIGGAPGARRVLLASARRARY
ncbi:MAG TPA: methyltransferase domain-containing protein [Solirubrobacteraceae bacterium]|jgi:2-polyprenyl-3-methyl-5-hydroxy-6-metoxy-1,4-benzoquinol methylase|nr:methyltransferase domain-containing protein [Solirubrobacteraceae bacterium]